MKVHFVFLALLFTLTACGPTAEQQAAMTATAMTATAAAWTPTPTATYTPTITPSPTPTETPLPTLTPTATNSPTPTQDPSRYYPPDNTFSILAPEGWVVFDLGLKYPALIGPKVGEVTQNMVFIPETSTYPMEMYAAFVQDSITATLKGVNSIEEEFLTTSSGIDYFRWVAENNHQGIVMRQLYYIFANGDWKLTIIYTRQEGNAPEQDKLVDGLVDTFRFEP